MKKPKPHNPMDFIMQDLVGLWDKYLAETVSERTIELTNLDTGKKEPREMKGDMDGFIEWLRKQ